MNNPSTGYARLYTYDKYFKQSVPYFILAVLFSNGDRRDLQ